MYIFTPLTADAKQWCDENVDVPDYMWKGQSFVCEGRYAWDLTLAMLTAGLGDGNEKGLEVSHV